jgi:hypothetical protein
VESKSLLGLLDADYWVLYYGGACPHEGQVVAT